jgi:superfamily II RNA helicase
MQTEFLKIVKSGEAVEGFPADLAQKYPYELDNFQQHAVAAIHREENVLVTAKTGSGKTLVGEYQIAYSLRKGGRVFYTTPIKSLSNQKFHDLKEMFPSVGIVTGDIKFQPDAAIVVMTTECLRNMLYKKGTSTESLGLTAGMSLTGLDAVIFDEVHYINNRERGKVWEETMILLPPEVKLILLSATIDGAEAFAAWLGALKQRCMWLIPTTHRVVPLKHCVLMDFNSDPIVVMDEKENFRDASYDHWLHYRKKICDDYEAHKKKVAGRRLGGYEDPVIKQAAGERPKSYTAELNAMANYLSEKSLLPALFFVFSRAACETHAQKIEGSYTTSSEAASIRHIISFHLHRYGDVLKSLKQYHDLVALLERGIAYHHSGLLPILKEIVEVLFGKGLVKVMFCTETFAVGINMPTKTVVFCDIKKYDETERGLRVLATDEYIQMAGRAGRRGKDKEGLVLYLPSRDPVGTGAVKLMMTGRKTTLRSRMDFHYDFILKTLQSGSLNWLKISQDSFWHKQQMVEAEGQRRHIESLQSELWASGVNDDMAAEVEEGRQLEARFKSSVNAAKRAAQAALESWKNKHAGPSWLLTKKKCDDYAATRAILNKELGILKEMEATTAGPEATIRFLVETGFLKDVVDMNTIGSANLTLKGILATEVNEGNPILLVEAYDAGYFTTMEAFNIVLVLAAFVKEKQEREGSSLNNIPISERTKQCLWEIDHLARVFQEKEGAAGVQIVGGFWELSLFWLEPIHRWLEGDTAATVCASFGIYEGNLYKTLMSLNNMLNEVIAIATFCQHTDMIDKLKGCGEVLLRDIAINDSLYLRI